MGGGEAVGSIEEGRRWVEGRQWVAARRWARWRVEIIPQRRHLTLVALHIHLDRVDGRYIQLGEQPIERRERHRLASAYTDSRRVGAFDSGLLAAQDLTIGCAATIGIADHVAPG